MSIEANLIARLKINQEGCTDALKANNMVAYRALVEQEARIMDDLRVLWGNRHEH